MNFDQTDEQQMIVETVARWVEADSPVSRFREQRETENSWDAATWRAMGEHGWLGVCFPEELGGFGGDFLDAALILEQLGRGLVPEPYIPSVILAGGLLARLGTPEQQTQFLAPMIEGQTSLALAYAERQSRYALNDCLTSATERGNDFILAGEKTWVLNGHCADQVIVAARTSGEQLDERGISLFVVDGDSPNLTRVSAKGMDGQTTALLRFDGVEVPKDRLLGSLDAGLPDLEWAIDRGAAASCAEGLGCVEELFERTIAYLKQREQFGVPIGTFQALQHRASDMFSETELCKSTMLLSAIQADHTNPETRKAEVSAAKFQLTKGGWYVQENAIQLFGGIGVTDEQDEGLFFKRLRVLQGLFGDADYHVARFQELDLFDAAIRAEA
jgi:alkylation response protein AidB-like acyl-CoA dehydrogenase